MNTRQITRRLFANTAAPLALVLLTSGCGGGGKSSPAGTTTPLSSPGILQPNVAPLPDDGSVTVTNVTPSSITLNGKIPSLKPGMVIAGGPAPGVMRKVVSAVQSGNSEVVQTTDASLSDVFQQASMKFSGPVALTPLIPPTVADNRLVNNSIPSASESPLAISTAYEQSFPLGSVIDSASGEAALTVSGTATIGMSIDCDIEINSASHVNSARFIPTATLTLNNFAASSSADAQLSLVPLELGHLDCEPIEFIVAGVPTWITPSIALSSTALGEVQAGMSAQGSGQVSIGAGFIYNGTSISPVTTYNQSLNASASFNGSANATCEFTPVNLRFQALVDDVTGPYLSLDCPKLTFGLHTNPPPLTIDADFDGTIGLSVNVFGGNDIPAIPPFGKTFHLYPSYNSYDASSSPSIIAGQPYWGSGVALGNIPGTPLNGEKYELSWGYSYYNGAYNSSDEQIEGFSASYIFYADSPINFGQTYTLPLDTLPGLNETSGGYILPGTPPSQIQVEVDQNPDGSVTVNVTGAPSWMLPPTNTFEPDPATNSSTGPMPNIRGLRTIAPATHGLAP